MNQEPQETGASVRASAAVASYWRRRSRWLPFVLAAGALLALNLGVHTRLSGSTVGLATVAGASEDQSVVIADAPATAPELIEEDAAIEEDVTIEDDAATEEAVIPADEPVTVDEAAPLVVPAEATTTEPTRDAGIIVQIGPIETTEVGTVLVQGMRAEAAEPAEPERITYGFTETDDSGWTAIGGTWARIDGRLVQDQGSGYDLSLIRDEPIGYPMTWRTSFEHLTGAGAGLVFDLPSTDSHAGGHLVRYMGVGNALAWGAFDEAGVFLGQGGVTLPESIEASHEIAVQSDGQTYRVFLDGQELAADIPVIGPSERHHVGLTTSETRVAFDVAELETGRQPQVSDESRPGAAQVEPAGSPLADSLVVSAASGTWASDGDRVSQSGAGLVDHVADLGLTAASFEIEADITLTAADESQPGFGGGLLFGMQAEADRRNAYMVRFADGGSELFWGRFDEQGVFQGAGGIPFSGTPGEPLQLRLRVDGGSLDIDADGIEIARGIPLDTQPGRIGLTSFGGPVSFSDLKVTVDR